MAGTKIILVRPHGETEWNVAKRIQGYSDSPLTPVGVSRRRRWASAWPRKNSVCCIPPTWGVCARPWRTLSRRPAMSPNFAEDLRERCYGVFEGKTMEECEKELPGQWSLYRGPDPHAVPPGGRAWCSSRSASPPRLSGWRSWPTARPW